VFVPATATRNVMRRSSLRVQGAAYTAWRR